MGRFFEALKAGVKGFNSANEPTEYSVAGRPVRCPHCGETKFASGTGLLNTRMRSAFNVDWADPSATILICAECGRVEWFVKEPTETAEP
jgi:ribosomal protein S27E